MYKMENPNKTPKNKKHRFDRSGVLPRLLQTPVPAAAETVYGRNPPPRGGYFLLNMFFN
jgi:hypothetical protein